MSATNTTATTPREAKTMRVVVESSPIPLQIYRKVNREDITMTVVTVAAIEPGKVYMMDEDDEIVADYETTTDLARMLGYQEIAPHGVGYNIRHTSPLHKLRPTPDSEICMTFRVDTSQDSCPVMKVTVRWI